MWELIYLTGFAHLQKGNIYISRVVELRVVQRDAMGVPGEKSFEEGVKHQDLVLCRFGQAHPS
jgi:hypothetical protein